MSDELILPIGWRWQLYASQQWTKATKTNLDAVLKPEFIVMQRDVELSFKEPTKCRQWLSYVHVLNYNWLTLPFVVTISLTTYNEPNIFIYYYYY